MVGTNPLLFIQDKASSYSRKANFPVVPATVRSHENAGRNTKPGLARHSTSTVGIICVSVPMIFESPLGTSMQLATDIA